MEDFQFSCTTNTLTSYARMSPHHVWEMDESLRIRVGGVREDQREQIQSLSLSVTDGTVYGVLKKASELTKLKECVLLLKLAFAA